MQRFVNNKYPKDKSLFLLVQEYAWDGYLVLFSILMMVIFLFLIKKQDLLFAGLFGVFLVIALSNAIAVIRMKKVIVEIGFKEGHFYFKDIYGVATRKKTEFFPLPYANPKRVEDGLAVTYFDQIIIIKREDWEEDWGEILYFFGFISYGVTQT